VARGGLGDDEAVSKWHHLVRRVRDHRSLVLDGIPEVPTTDPAPAVISIPIRYVGLARRAIVEDSSIIVLSDDPGTRLPIRARGVRIVGGPQPIFVRRPLGINPAPFC